MRSIDLLTVGPYPDPEQCDHSQSPPKEDPCGKLPAHHAPPVAEQNLLEIRGLSWGDATVLVLATEGVTDPEMTENILKGDVPDDRE